MQQASVSMGTFHRQPSVTHVAGYCDRAVGKFHRFITPSVFTADPVSTGAASRAGDKVSQEGAEAMAGAQLPALPRGAERQLPGTRLRPCCVPNPAAAGPTFLGSGRLSPVSLRGGFSPRFLCRSKLFSAYSG